MGCGASGASGVAKALAAHVVKTPSEIFASDEKQEGKIQLIVGRVATAEHVIKPPFGEEDAVAINVRAFKMRPGSGTQKPEFLFSGFSAVDFKIVDSFGKEISVDTKRAGTWQIHMRATHQAWNIACDSNKGGIVSGGTENYQYSKQELKPNAEDFWKQFGRGKDDLEDLSDMATGPNLGGLNKGVAIATGVAEMAAISFVMRKAKESSIRVGDAVAVCGTLRAIDDGMVLEGGGEDALITNCPAHLKELQELPALVKNEPSAPVGRVNMDRDLAKCLFEKSE